MGRRFAILGSRGYPSTYGGFETFVRRLAPYLVEQGDDVTVYCRDGDVAETAVDGVRCVRTRGIDSTAMSTLSYGATAARHASTQHFDAILVLNIANGFFLPMLRRAGIPTLVNVDGVEWERAKWNRLGRAMFRRGARLTARHATEIVVDSLEMGRIWKETWDRDSIFLPYGADLVTSQADGRVRSLGLAPHKYLLAVARLVPENNIGLFLDAIDRMNAKLPAVVVGSRAKSDALVERLRARAATDDNFRWLGHVDDQDLLTQLWANCAVYFHGHSAGGTNPGLLQALGLGAPTVALNTPFNDEVLANPAQLVPADPAQVAAAFDRVVDNRDTQRDFAEHGREAVAHRYTWDEVLHGYRDALEGLVGHLS